MKQFVPGLPWAIQESRCVLLYDNAPFHTAAVDAFIRACGVFPLRLPPYSPEFQRIEEVFSEYSFALKSAHYHYPGIPDAFLHAVAFFPWIPTISLFTVLTLRWRPRATFQSLVGLRERVRRRSSRFPWRESSKK